MITDAGNKTIADMTSDEFVKMVLDAYNVAWRKSSYRIQPTNIAMDASDFMLAMQKFDPTPVIVGTDLLPIAAMDRIMAALRKASGNDGFNITFVKVPSNYAVGIKAGKESFIRDGASLKETYDLQVGSLTTQPTQTKNNQDVNALMEYTIEFRNIRRNV
ncbi:TPA: major capsid family protein [Yersinia enterocolitica]